MVRSAHGQDSIPPDGKPDESQPQWRRDFPIDVAQDQYIARRDFAKFMVLTSLAFAVGQFWIVVKNMARRREGRPPIREIARLDSLAPGSAIRFSYPDAHDDCLLVRKDENTLLAFSQKCTHLSCAVKPEMDKGVFHCPCHEGFFDMLTGRPLAGPPRRPLPKVSLEVRNGVVYATGVEVRTT